jgi:hypothetical protein
MVETELCRINKQLEKMNAKMAWRAAAIENPYLYFSGCPLFFIDGIPAFST